MATRSAHGNARARGALLVVETLPADELPAGVPEGARPESRADRGEGGRLARGNSLASKGGKARAGKTRLAVRLGLAAVPEGSGFAPYARGAVSFRRAQCAALAASVGGGHRARAVVAGRQRCPGARVVALLLRPGGPHR